MNLSLYGQVSLRYAKSMPTNLLLVNACQKRSTGVVEMNNKDKPLDIYLMGIGGTGMGAFAGLLKQKGFRITGSDQAVYSPMKEKLRDWGINYHTPYHGDNLPKVCDLVIVGNVIRKDNPEAIALRERQLPFDSFPGALNRLFLQESIPIVASGTHGKTTCSALLAHTLYNAHCDPGFLIGGIPNNFGDSFRLSNKRNSPFVVEGDEYDTAYFDKRPKFIHYDPKYLLVTSLEFDHGDIYKDLSAVIDAFSSLMKNLSQSDVMVVYNPDNNIKTAIRNSACQARLFSYGEAGDYQACNSELNSSGIYFEVAIGNKIEGAIHLPLFGEHNLKNALGCYAILHQFGLNHAQIKAGFASFLGVKRRLEERLTKNDIIIIDDFAHHPSAVKETIKAAKQRYPQYKICAIFEPRSATSCMKVFESQYEEALLAADLVKLSPVGRNLPKEDRIDTEKIAMALNERGVLAKAFFNYEDLRLELINIGPGHVLLFMSNGDFKGMLADIDKILT